MNQTYMVWGGVILLLLVLGAAIVALMASIASRSRVNKSVPYESGESDDNTDKVAKVVKKEKEEKAKYYVQLFGIPIPPGLLIAFGLLVLNALLYGVLPDLWEPFFRNQKMFWSINIGLWLASYLLVMRDPEDKKKSHPIAGRISTALITLVVVGIIVTWIKTVREGYARSEAYKTTPNSTVLLPLYVALPMIADCESGDGTPGSGKQFETDGKVVMNKAGSTAIGKYQILESVWGMKAKELGYDLHTEEGNTKFAEWLYTNYRTRPWEADPRSRACWEPKIHGPYNETRIAKANSPSAPVDIPDKYRLDWAADGPFEAINNFGQKAVYDPQKKIFEEIASSTQVRFRSLTDREVKVVATLKPM